MLRNYLVIFVALAVVVGGALAWKQYLELIQLRTDALAGGTRADLQKRLWDTQKRNHELENELALLREGGPSLALNGDREAATGEGRRGGPGNPPGARGGFRAGFENNLTALLENPEFSQLWTAQQKARFFNTRQDLVKRLKLTSGEASKLADLTIERQLALMDVLSAARSQGLTGRESRDEIRALVKQANSEIDGQIKSLLGDERYADFQNYQRTQPQRAEISELERRLGYTSTPLLDYQADQMVQILAETSPQNARRGGGGPVGGGIGGGLMGGGGAFGGRGGIVAAPGGGVPIADNTVVRAQSVLSGPQLEVLRQMQQEQQTQQQLQSLVRETFRFGEGRNRRGGGTSASGEGTPSSAPAPRPQG
ncbi:MAG: hypothetical protein A3G75_08170 [Verrucomicrobia bacterium RIFCSPLOWO2_12_FULL_64_8]|nr:MAG: hypothetical protein A3G75_08170 [Verrucomicrobia bacterium RIFCSPLOWO2_12_FULL_64_8]